MHFESRIRNALCHSAAFGRIDRFLLKKHMLLLNVFSATAPYSTQACYNDVPQHNDIPPLALSAFEGRPQRSSAYTFAELFPLFRQDLLVGRSIELSTYFVWRRNIPVPYYSRA